MAFLVLLAGIWLQVHSQCKPFKCEDLSSNVCAFIQEDEIQVNAAGCADDTCKLSLIRDNQNNYSVGTKVGCNYKTTDIDDVEEPVVVDEVTDDADDNTNDDVNDEVTDDTDDDTSDDKDDEFNLDDYDDDFSNVNIEDVDQDEYNIYIKCPAADSLKKLVEGSYPKICEGPTDCQRQDGTLGTCACAIDGNSYCTPHELDDDLIDWYWEKCAENEMTLEMSDHRTWMLSAFNDASTELNCYGEFPDGKMYAMDADDLLEDDEDFSGLLTAGVLFLFFS